MYLNVVTTRKSIASKPNMIVGNRYYDYDFFWVVV